MKNSNQTKLLKQTSLSSEASLVRTQISNQSYLNSSPNSLNQFLRSSFKVYSEMKEDLIQNQQCKLSLRYEQIYLLMATQKLFMYLQKMQEHYKKLQKQEAFYIILRLAAIDYSNCSSFFKSSQGCNSPGIVSKDIGMERKIQNQQLIKIIQELQLQIAGQEISKALSLFQNKILKETFQQLKWIIKVSQHLEKIKLIIETSNYRNALNQLKQKAICTRKFEAGLLLLNLKIKKIILSNQFYFFYSFKVQSIQCYAKKTQKTKKKQIEVSFKLQDESLKLLKLYQFFIRYCYRYPFDQFRKQQYLSLQSEVPLRSSNILQRLSNNQISQVIPQQQSQIFESIHVAENQSQEQQEISQSQVQKPKVEIKQSGKIARSIKLYLNEYEKQQLQIQQSKIKLKLYKKPKVAQEIQVNNIKRQLNNNKQIICLIFSIIIFCIALVFLFQ
ncbi:unnamed protein product [Paramecium octaurelia]|uniref:Transmembrane protein n=1 Tax=Paramecium octaurelia TaxID=43137 RepID=A0A8S1S1P0_PAROT|nr:unnamed protein product [Paramecium octaurelia]